jgi:hypothetical protein
VDFARYTDNTIKMKPTGNRLASTNSISDKIELESFIRPAEQAAREENLEELSYINTHINPIMSRIMIKIIN